MDKNLEEWVYSVLQARLEVYDLWLSASEVHRELVASKDIYTQEEYIYNIRMYAYLTEIYIEEIDFYEDWLYCIRLHTYHTILIGQVFLS